MLFNIRQAIRVVIEANIGTTVTSFIISFKLGRLCITHSLFRSDLSLLYPKNALSIISVRVLFGVEICFEFDEWCYGADENLDAFRLSMIKLVESVPRCICRDRYYLELSSATIGILQEFICERLD